MNKYVAIWHIIKDRKGKPKAINQHIITNQYIRLNGGNISCREVRRIIRELIEEGYPIVSTPEGGYFNQEKEEEGLECYRRLRRQGIRILLRARNVLRNSRTNQQELF